MNDKPIPNVAPTPLDLSAIAKEASAPPTISLADANIQYGFVHCCDCGVGGHTGHTLLTIIRDVTTGKEDKACQEHAKKYLRPKDLKHYKRRS